MPGADPLSRATVTMKRLLNSADTFRDAEGEIKLCFSS